MALIPFTVTVIDHVNNPNNTLANTNIEIRTTQAGEPLAQIYSDDAGLNPIPQPGAQTNNLGVFYFYAESEGDFDYKAVSSGFSENISGNSHNKLTNLNAVGGHDAIYRRAATVAQIESGVFAVESRLSVTDRGGAPFDIEPIGIHTINGLDVLDAGSGNIAKLVISDSINMIELGATTSKIDNTPEWDKMIEIAAANGIKAVIDKTYLMTQTATIIGGNYVVDMRGGKLIFDAAVAFGLAIGTSSGRFSGSAYGLNAQKLAVNSGLTDYGITYINALESYFESCEQRNFDYGHAFLPSGAAFVAYCTFVNSLSFNHIFGIYTEPQVSGGYVTENTWIGGRCHATEANRLNSHIRLNDASASKDKIDHLRFYGISIEGWSGGGSSGSRAVWQEYGEACVFHHCRTEEYNDGWDVAPYHFQNSSRGNSVTDYRIETRIQDDSTGYGQVYETISEGNLINKRSGSVESPSLIVKRNNNTDGTTGALEVIDTATSAPGISLLKLQSLTNTFTVRGEEVVTITTATGKVLTIDDQGSLLPLSTNKGWLGNPAQRWKELYTNLSTFADDASAGTGGLVTGQAYKTASGELRVKL